MGHGHLVSVIYQRTDKGATVALIPKVGLQSMRYSLRCRHDLTIDDVRNDPVRVVFLRHPHARLVSAYRFFKTIYADGSTPQEQDPQPADVTSWGAFLEHVRMRANVHWRPQINVVRELNPTVIHRFEDIGMHWPTYHSMPYPHLNASKPHEVGAVPDDISARYAEEELLWLGL